MTENPAKTPPVADSSPNSQKPSTGAAQPAPKRPLPPYQPDFFDYVIDYGPAVFRYSILSVVGPFVLFLILLALPFTRPPLLRALGGEPHDQIFKFEHMPDGYTKGLEGCKLDERTSGCEDMSIHHGSGSVFLACGNPLDRLTWFPPLLPMCKHKSEAANRDTAYKYDLETGSLTPLKVLNLQGGFRLHGLSLYEEADEPKKVWLHFINHKEKGSCVSMFRHFLGTDELDHIGTVCDSLITSPNDVAATSRNSFYVTNDHKYSVHTLISTLEWPWYAAWVYKPFVSIWPTVLRIFEDVFAPFRWTNVIHCQEGSCRVAADGLVGANGLLLSGDGKTLFVNNFAIGRIYIYERDTATNDLTKRGEIIIGAGIDNLSYDPNTDEYLVALFPNLHKAGPHFMNPFDTTKYAPSGVGKFRYNSSTSGEISMDIVYYDPGKLTGDTTVAVSDSKRSKSLVGNVMSKGFVVCDHAL